MSILEIKKYKITCDNCYTSRVIEKELFDIDHDLPDSWKLFEEKSRVFCDESCLLNYKLIEKGKYKL